MESGYTYPERSDNKLAAGEAQPKAATEEREEIRFSYRYYQKSAEVIVGRKRAIERMEASQTNRRTEC